MSRAQLPKIKTKSGLMLGLGESRGELFDTLADLLDSRMRIPDAGPIPAAGPTALPSRRTLSAPDEFDELGDAARRMGFRQVASGPFVRSSYHAREMAE